MHRHACLHRPRAPLIPPLPQVRRLHFEAVWDRVLRSGLRKSIGRNDASGEGAEQAVESVRDALWAHNHLLAPLFEFYAALNGFCGVIGLNAFSQFVEDCQLSSARSEFTKKSDLDRLFIAVDTASKQVEAEAETDGMNRSKALSVDEFVVSAMHSYQQAHPLAHVYALVARQSATCLPSR